MEKKKLITLIVFGSLLWSPAAFAGGWHHHYRPHHHYHHGADVALGVVGGVIGGVILDRTLIRPATPVYYPPAPYWPRRRHHDWYGGWQWSPSWGWYGGRHHGWRRGFRHDWCD